MADTNIQGISSSLSGVGVISSPDSAVTLTEHSIRKAAKKNDRNARKTFYDATEALKTEEHSTYQSPSEKRD